MMSPMSSPSSPRMRRVGSPATPSRSEADQNSDSRARRPGSAVRHRGVAFTHLLGAPMKLYQSSASPNSRRVRIFLAEKGISMPLVPVDLGAKEQFSEAYAAINP